MSKPEQPEQIKITWVLEEAVENILHNLGFDTSSPGFIETPSRVARFYLDFINQDPPVIKTFPCQSTNIVRLNNYETYGLCPHHLLPVKYMVSICYQPDGLVFGISKLPRIVDYMLRTLPLQEDLPRMIVDYLFKVLHVQYAQASVDGLHMCMTMRGVKAKDCTLTTFYERHRREQEDEVPNS